MNLLPLKFLTAFFIFSIANLFAQGSLKGVVTDSLSGETLVGANIFIVGTALGGVSDIQGEFRISNVPEGNHQLRVSYIGYKSKTFTVTIQQEEILELNVTLVPDVLEGETVVVTGQALGQAAAINQQLTSNTIVNIISEEKIQELPDANAAEAIGRLPGVSLLRSGGEANKIILRGLNEQYTNITIDGISIPSTSEADRSLDLSTISQSSLAGIELFKALTSDKDADAIAGTVNLVTKKAPSEREIRAILKGGYNNLMESAKQYDFSLKYGERFFNDLFGVQLNGNIQQKIRSNERIDLDYDQGLKQQTDYKISDFHVQFIDEDRRRKNFSLLLDFDTPDNGSIKFNNVYNSTERDYLQHGRNYPTADNVFYSFRDREQTISTFNSALTGNNNLFGLNFTWGLSFAQSRTDFPYDYEMSYLEPSILGSSGMKATPVIKDHPEQLIPYAYNNFTAATLYEANYRGQENFEKDRSVYLNISKEYTFGSQISGMLKIGGKYRSKNRSNSESLLYSPYYLGSWQAYERSPDGTIRQKQLSGSYFDAFWNRYLSNPLFNTISFVEFLDSPPESREIFDLYDLNPLISRDKLRQWYELNKNGIGQNGSGIEYSNDPSVKANFYDIVEDVTAGYIMNVFNYGQNITFIAGFRIEKEDNFYKNKWSPINTGGFPIPADASRDTTGGHAETIYLPNFNLLVKPTDFLNIRFAVYKALARPNFNYRLNTYFAWRPAASTSNRQLVIGNPLLKTAQAWNYEINTSFYGNDIGLLSLSAFYKEIKDMYHILDQINTDGNTLLESLGLQWKTLHTGTYQLTVPYNSPASTKIWGFELSHQINFTFLPGLLKNIVLSYNASYVKSETILIGAVTDTILVNVPGFPFPIPSYRQHPVEIKQKLENQPEFFGNVSLGYDIDGFSARLSLFHQTKYNVSFTPMGLSDRINNGFTRLDLAISQKITDNITALLSINNLTDFKEEDAIQDRVHGYTVLNTSPRFGLTADFGVRVDL